MKQESLSKLIDAGINPYDFCDDLVASFLSFEEARDFVYSLGLKSKSGWVKYISSGMKPKNIHSYPDTAYKSKGWISWADWLGSVRSISGKFLPFKNARKFVHKLGLSKTVEWVEYTKSGKKPPNIPAFPNSAYAEWNGMADWLGTVSVKEKDFLSFDNVRTIVRSLNLKNQREWRQYSKINRFDDIPSAPDQVYKDKWISWGDFLGTGRHHKAIQFLSFNDARKFMRSLGLLSKREWQEYCRKNRKPDAIPYSPDRFYQKEWAGWHDWLNSPKSRWLPFKIARKYVRSLKLKNDMDWREYCSSGDRPYDIPSNPKMVYGSEWKGLRDWLGADK